MIRQITSRIAPSRMDFLLSWIVNFVIVLVLPARLGLANASLTMFLGYAGVSGAVLMIAEDHRFIHAVFQRTDVRGYLAARIAIVATFGACPYLIACTVA